MIKDFSNKRKIKCIVDFHSHFGAFNSFFMLIIEKIIFLMENFSLLLVLKKVKLFLLKKVVFQCQNIKKELEELIYLMN